LRPRASLTRSSASTRAAQGVERAEDGEDADAATGKLWAELRRSFGDAVVDEAARRCTGDADDLVHHGAAALCLLASSTPVVAGAS
jgi:hypothetical protein